MHYKKASNVKNGRWSFSGFSRNNLWKYQKLYKRILKHLFKISLGFLLLSRIIILKTFQPKSFPLKKLKKFLWNTLKLNAMTENLTTLDTWTWLNLYGSWNTEKSIQITVMLITFRKKFFFSYTPFYSMGLFLDKILIIEP